MRPGKTEVSVEYGIEKPSNKLLALAELDPNIWARGKKLKPETGRRKPERENQGRKKQGRKKQEDGEGKEPPLTAAALRLGISAFCFPNFSFSARPPAPSPPKGGPRSARSRQNAEIRLLRPAFQSSQAVAADFLFTAWLPQSHSFLWHISKLEALLDDGGPNARRRGWVASRNVVFDLVEVFLGQRSEEDR